jgi:phosphoglycerate dehydrogenase-like enzyme
VSVPRAWVGPEPNEAIAAAVERGGAALAARPEDAEAFVWLSYSRAAEITEVLHDGIRWVQLPSAGVDRWVAQGLLDDRRTWTGAQGAYADDVAEHVLAFILAAARRLPHAAKQRSWVRNEGRRLAGATVGIVGAGGIGTAVIERLAPFGVGVLALTRSGREIPGAKRSLPSESLDELLEASDYVVLALPLTEESRGLIGARELDLIGPDGWLLNVARGAIVQTDALVEALRGNRIAGACLDVTEPEPLPDGHPLWDFENVLVTPHVANPPQLEIEVLAARVEDNVRRFAAGEELVGVIEVGRGY